jgi:hypothetical protein
MIKIELNNPSFVFQPGQPIKGTVSWSDLSETKLEVRLIWYTIGKGDRDVACVDVKHVEQPGPSGSSEFSIVAPHRPVSFSGKLMSLIWAIEVVTFPNKEAKQAELTISRSDKEILLTPIPKAERIGKASVFSVG